MKKLFETNIPALIVIIVILLLFWFFIIRGAGCSFMPSGCNDPVTLSETAIINDPGLTNKYITELKRDTVIIWRDKIIYKASEPVLIYVTKFDSAFIEIIKPFDFMMKVKKEGRLLEVTAVNLQDSILKRYIYNDVGEDFILSSKARGLFVKSKRFYYEGLTAYGGYGFNNLEYKNGFIFAGLKTGANYSGVTGIELAGEYNFTKKDFTTKANLKLKLF